MPTKDPDKRRAQARERARRQRAARPGYQSAKDREWKNAHPTQWQEQHARANAKQHKRRRSLGIELREVDYSTVLGFKGFIPWSVYNTFLDWQEGGCAICGIEPQPGIPLACDHRHGEKKIRGLLCKRCNMLLGMALESPDILINAMRYLESPPSLRFSELQLFSAGENPSNGNAPAVDAIDHNTSEALAFWE